MYLFCKKIQRKISKTTGNLIDACLKEVVSKCNYNLTEHVINYFHTLIVQMNKTSKNLGINKTFKDDINCLVEIASLYQRKIKQLFYIWIN